LGIGRGEGLDLRVGGGKRDSTECFKGRKEGKERLGVGNLRKDKRKRRVYTLVEKGRNKGGKEDV